MLEIYYLNGAFHSTFNRQINRRMFTRQAIQLGMLGWLPTSGVRLSSPLIKSEVQILTRGPRHHFFGYYGICPWNQEETHVLRLESLQTV